MQILRDEMLLCVCVWGGCCLGRTASRVLGGKWTQERLDKGAAT